MLVALAIAPAAMAGQVERRIYAFDSVSDSYAGFGAFLGAAKGTPMSRYRAVFRGKVEFDVGVGSKTALITFEPDSIELLIDGSVLTGKASEVKREIHWPILVALTDDWKVASCRFGLQVSPGTERYARYLLSLSQFADPRTHRRTGQTWEETEAAPTGRYRAKYQVLSRARNGRLRVRKTITTLRPSDGSTPMSGKRTPGGSLMLVVDSRERLVSESGTLKERTTVDGKETAKSSSRVYVRLLSHRVGPAPDAAGAVAMGRPVGLYERPNPDSQEADIERSALGDATEAQLLAELDQAVKAADPSYDPTPLYLKLHALAYLRPHSCAVLGRRLEASPPDGLQFQLLARALVAAGTDAAQNTLALVVQESSDDWDKDSRLIPALVGLKRPSTTMVACVEAVSTRAKNGDLRDMATMVLGALGRQLSIQGSVRAKPVLHSLAAKLASSRATNEKRITLLALGNTGAEQVAVIARPYLKSGDPSLRSAAVTALRWVPGSRPPALICTALAGDGSSDVREAAAEALSYVSPTAKIVEALHRALGHDASATVRAAALGSIWLARSKFPKVLGYVAGTAQSDPSREVRKTAKKLLASQRSVGR
ncbi:MAG: HEAT repeat domain-containing protein [Fimbriimonadaceae bacterium]